MNRPSLRSQLLRAYLLAVMIPLIGLAIWLPDRLRRDALSHLEHELTVRASLVSYLLSDRWMQDPGKIAPLCQRIGQRFGLRVTVIDKKGRVLGDSQADPADMDNHADRPEVRQALEEGIGHATRHSDTVNRDLFYTAIRVHGRADVLGVLRVAEPLTHVEQTVRSARYLLWGAFAATFALSLGLALRFSKALASPILQISQMAARVTEGEVGQRVRVDGSREIVEMAESFNRMSEQMAATIRQIADDKQKLEAILGRMADGIIIVDREGQIQLFNSAAEKILGVSGEGAIGKPIILLTFNYRMTQMLQKALKTGSSQTGEVDLHTPARRILKVYAVPAQSDAGELLGAVVVMQDLTEIRRLESIRRDFVANVSHELRTPIASVKATAEALLSGAKDEPEVSDHFLETIIRESDRLTVLVDDLLDLARAESQDIRLEQTDVDLRPLVEDIFTKFEFLARENRLNLANDVPEGIILWADREALRQILTNLVDNAVKYTQPEGSIRVHAGAEEDFIGIHVTDTGIGIPLEHQSRIFERFYRVDKARSRSLGGTGLGLSIVKHLVESHGGSVHVLSTLGQGSTFTVRIPRGFHLN